MPANGGEPFSADLRGSGDETRPAMVAGRGRTLPSSPIATATRNYGLLRACPVAASRVLEVDAATPFAPTGGTVHLSVARRTWIADSGPGSWSRTRPGGFYAPAHALDATMRSSIVNEHPFRRARYLPYGPATT